MQEFQIKTGYIELVKLLKLIGVAETGGHAKILVEEGQVLRNGEKEFRKKAKLRAGDTIEALGEVIKIVD